MRSFIGVLQVLGLVSGVTHFAQAGSGQKPPNIVLIVADDQGYANIGYHNSTVLTPRIDALAKDGVILESYYVQPICSPTRSSLMTGRYTYRLGTQATVIRADVPFGIPLSETFMAQNLKDVGYVSLVWRNEPLCEIECIF
eukprot:m.198142 g.198142  ORF g.198142 m.198142 type:complete len:141 (+) comp18735_c0_seq5:155-577(+)